MATEFGMASISHPEVRFQCAGGRLGWSVGSGALDSHSGSLFVISRAI